MAAQGGECAVDLFGQHGAGEFVGQSHGREREQEIGAGTPVGRKTIVTSDQEHQVLRIEFCTAKEIGELRRVHGAAGGIEEDAARGRMFRDEVNAAGVDFGHRARHVASGALEELGGDGVRVRVARFADEIEIEFQGGVTTVAGVA